jgi:ABC-type sugar transport system ATPase subunit
MDAAFIEFAHITKRFGASVALDDVSFSIDEGEIHAIVGENGAGKSTLINLLAGVHKPDAGTLRLKGEDIQLGDPARAQHLGIRIVYQEFNLFPDLTVAANVYAGSESRRLGFLRDRAMRQRSREILTEWFGADINVRSRVASLSVAHQQLVEIARALVHEARVIVLDEPNSALTEEETERLFTVLRGLRDKGVTIVLVSHRLDEVFSIANTITVLRDGRQIATRPIGETSVRKVIDLMVGSALEPVVTARARSSDEAVVLAVEGLTVKNSVFDASFAVRRGEILGVAGLDGSGVRELFMALFGLLPLAQGVIAIDGLPRRLRNPRDAMKLGVAYLPASRRDEGLFFDFDIGENASFLLVRACSRWGLTRRRLLLRKADGLLGRLDVRAASSRAPVAGLSGGNQQKVVLAKWLSLEPRIIVLHDPTRGIDVGAKAEIYSIIERLAADGVAVLVTSPEFEEIAFLADRTLVIYRGRAIGELEGGVSGQAIAHAASTGLLEAITSSLPPVNVNEGVARPERVPR